MFEQHGNQRGKLVEGNYINKDVDVMVVFTVFEVCLPKNMINIVTVKIT